MINYIILQWLRDFDTAENLFIPIKYASSGKDAGFGENESKTRIKDYLTVWFSIMSTHRKNETCLVASSIAVLEAR